MKRTSDDEALSWGDENDPTYVAPDLDDEFDDEFDDEDHSPDGAAALGHSNAAVSTGAATTPAAHAAATAENEATPAAPVTNAYPRVVASTAATAVDVETDDDTAQPLSSAALIAFGIFGGILFLYTIGWLVGFMRNPPTADGLGGIVQAVLSVLTIFAPALWFVATLLLGAKRGVRTRILWLLIGVIVLVPWPFVTGY